MRTQNRSFRLTAVVAIAGLLLAQAPPLAMAQPAPPPPSAQQGDPPTRVGRLAQVSGTVSFHTQDETQWGPALPNYPITAGNSFWTQPGAQTSIEVSASRIVMAPQTELDVTNLTDTAFQATVPQGEVYLHVQAVTPDEAYAVQTPRGLVTLASPGRYGIAAGDTQNPTVITVVQGSAHVEGPGVSMDVAGNQTATIIGTDSFQASVGPAQPDAFITAMLNAERPPAAAQPSVVASMPGGDDLSAYGTWTDSSDYGQVWYPQVAPGWVPYSDGQWTYVAPWGWTWVDTDPWGFAPFHYGRWAQIGGRWGWVPGGAVVGPPVYAPALVAFFGIGAAVGVGIGAALAGGRIGWFPLGPQEAYHPWYHASPGYFRQVNVRNVRNITTINRTVTINNFINRRAATVVPASTLTASQPVGRFAQRADPAQLAQARPVIGAEPLRPAASTIGVTPAVAHQFNLPAATSHGVAPGPAIRATPTGATGAIVHPGPPALHNPAVPAVPAATAIHPVAPATPALRPPEQAGHVGPPPVEHGTPVVAPGAVPHAVPAPAATVHPSAPEHPVAPTVHPVPNVAPSHVTPAVQPEVHAVPPAPAAVHAPPPPVHTVPAPAVVHEPAPAVVHTPPPAAYHPPPAPVVHAPPPAPAVVHAPPPAAHPAPAPASHPAPASEEHKRPGEP